MEKIYSEWNCIVPMKSEEVIRSLRSTAENQLHQISWAPAFTGATAIDVGGVRFVCAACTRQSLSGANQNSKKALTNERLRSLVRAFFSPYAISSELIPESFASNPG